MGQVARLCRVAWRHSSLRPCLADILVYRLQVSRHTLAAAEAYPRSLCGLVALLCVRLRLERRVYVREAGAVLYMYIYVYVQTYISIYISRYPWK